MTIYSFSVHSCYISFCPLTVLKHRISFVRHNEVMILKYNIKKYSAGKSETLWVESSLNRISADKSISKLMMNHFDKLSSVTENLSIFYFKSTQGLEGIRSLSRVFKYILLSLYPFLASDQWIFFFCNSFDLFYVYDSNTSDTSLGKKTYSFHRSHMVD